MQPPQPLQTEEQDQLDQWQTPVQEPAEAPEPQVKAPETSKPWIHDLYLVAILVAIGMFRASGAMDFLVTGMQPLLGLIGFPPENLPLALMRPLSGSGSLALLSDLVTEYGVESIYTRIGSTMYNSS